LGSPTFVDIDGDGDYDMFTEKGTINFYRNDGDATSPSWTFVTDNYESIGGGAPTFVDIDADGDYDLFIGKGDAISFYRNDGDATSPIWTFVTDNYESITVWNGSAPTFVDIDADGDYDMFVVEEDWVISFYRNDGDAVSPVWTFVTERYGDITSNGCCIRPAFIDIDGDSDYDVFAGGHWTIPFYRNDGTPEEASWTRVTHDYFPIDLAGNTAPAFTDIDNDGDLDMFVGQVHGQVHYYRNDGAPDAPSWTYLGGIGVGLGGEGRNHLHAFPAFVDIDNDGDYDLFIGEVFDWSDPANAGGNINFYRNDGTQESPVWTLVTENYANIDVGGWSTPTFADIDDDGDFDLFIGEYDGVINFYRNDSTPEVTVWVLVTENYAGIDVGEKSAPAFYDVDDDGDLDLFIGEGGGRVVFYRNDGDRTSPVWTFVTSNYNGIDVGRCSMPTFADIDGDGDKDLFIGEEDGGINFYRNLGDTPPPKVVGVFPEPYVQAPKNTRIVVAFSEQMDEATLDENTIKVEGSESGLVTGNIVYDDSTATVTFTPGVFFKYNEKITVTLTAEIKDLSGSSLDGDGDGISEGSPEDDFHWEFFIVESPPPHALSLDGVDDYVEIPHNDSLKLTESLTIEMWIKVIPTSGAFVLISNPHHGDRASGRGNYSIVVYRDRHEIEFGYQPPPGMDHIYIATNAVLNDEFNHLAVVHTFGDGTSTKIFLNGTQLSGNWIQGTGDEEVLINNEPIIMGAFDIVLRNFWNGLIDEVRIWNVARMREQIQDTMNRTLTDDETQSENLVGYWRFDDGTADDSSLYGNHGTVMGDAEIVPLYGTWPPKKIGDVSGNGTISAYDASLILQYVVGLIDKFPADSMGSPSAISPRPYVVSIPELSVKAGERFHVPIAIDDATGLFAGGISLKYDQTVLRAIKALPDMALNGSYWKANTELDGEVRFAFATTEVCLWFKPQATVGQGNILLVEFEVLPNTEGKTSPLIIDNVNLSNSLNITKNNGSVTVIPSTFALLQNYPNPFNPDTWIPFKLAADASVTISIYNAKGQLVRTIALGQRSTGVYLSKDKAAYWDGRDNLGEKVASGIYFYTFQAGNFIATRKLVVVK